MKLENDKLWARNSIIQNISFVGLSEIFSQYHFSLINLYNPEETERKFNR